jgi:hypothetical protein
MKRTLSDERGAVAIIVSLCLVLILGFLALAIDLGNGRQRKAQAQSSADFAALAGASVLKDSTAADATTEARSYVGKNDFSGAGATVNVPPASGLRTGDVQCVEVIPSEELPTTFGRIFGITSMTVAARAVACASPPLGGPYAVFAGSTTCADAVAFSGANRTVNGGVHSNNDMRVRSHGTVLNGEVTFLNGDPPAGNITVTPSVNNPRRISTNLPYPEVFDIADYAPLGEKGLLATGLLKYHYFPVEINETFLAGRGLLNPLTRTMAPGLYYTPGDVHLNISGYSGSGVTIVSANGDIHLNGNNLTFTPWDPDGLLLFSNKDQDSCSAGQAVIKLDGNTHSWTGVMYAPQGPIDFSGTNVGASLHGRLVGQTVSLSGSQQTITRNDSFPGQPGGFELAE